ncbi:regulatory protein RecX [Victivallaceae bacterium BBE-744-WT-12]|uniref:Regulatory protein RecX n=1 Tax=Victivallis lenta TaxID=2606640 RepID=A0A844G5Y7_9BACT|nr:regulatory protein RecX [Victivallis lenta]AVM47119.1 recombination regulator RecX [Victivallales bacterium CCUG 44730]MST97981.1 regulatory protein RecX [Victivallis lenta]HBP06582.1 regulatory protein RecX [Lentisphaeria bacterium]HCH84389.1 regulatory protein RecX [Lentisphaeria bacterium]
MEKPKKSAMEKAMRLLSRRALSERELLNKLCAAGYPFREARDAVAECRKRGYVNDEAFAADYTELLAGRCLGGRRIRLALRKRGIPAELQEEPLEAAAETEAERASEALAYKLRLLARETDPRRKREKAFRFLIGRGFSCESCRTALERADFDPEE